MDFAAISNRKAINTKGFGKGVGGEEYVTNSYGGNTDAWKEARRNALNGVIKNSIRAGEIVWGAEKPTRRMGEDKQWEAREESIRRANLERVLPTIPGGGEVGGFLDSEISHEVDDSRNQNGAKDSETQKMKRGLRFFRIPI